jgi:hypothetical protein
MELSSKIRWKIVLDPFEISAEFIGRRVHFAPIALGH